MKWFLGGFFALAIYEFFQVNGALQAYVQAEFRGDYVPYYYVYLAVLRSSLVEIGIAFLVLVAAFLYFRSQKTGTEG